MYYIQPTYNITHCHIRFAIIIVSITKRIVRFPKYWLEGYFTRDILYKNIHTHSHRSYVSRLPNSKYWTCIQMSNARFVPTWWGRLAMDTTALASHVIRNTVGYKFATLGCVHTNSRTRTFITLDSWDDGIACEDFRWWRAVAAAAAAAATAAAATATFSEFALFFENELAQRVAVAATCGRRRRGRQLSRVRY